MKILIVHFFLISMVLFAYQAYGHSESYQEIASTRNNVVIPTWLIVPEKPQASVILFAGGGGDIGISANGIKKTNNFLIRSRNLFADAGLAVAVVDVPSDRTSLRDFRTGKKHAKDIQAVITYLRQQYDVPVWLVGTSRGTISAANGAARLQQDGPDGIVLTSTVNQQSNAGADSVYNTKLKKITQPVLLAHHKKDDCYVCPYREMKRVMKKLKNTSKMELLTYEDGDNLPGNPCKALTYHGFLGIEPRVVNDIVTWIVN